MKTKKPDIFLGITMGMLVLAAVVCLVILFAQKSGNAQTTKNTMEQAIASQPANPGNTPSDSGKTPVDPNNTGSPVETADPNATVDPNATESPNPVVTDPVSTEPGTPVAPGTPIDKAGLKADLDARVNGLLSEWQVTVIDPSDGTTVSSTSAGCKEDTWMTVDKVMSVYIMGTAFQQVADGTLTEDQILEDVKAMVTKGDADATGRLTELLGGGDALEGRAKVKTFAKDNGMDVGFNPSKSKPTEKRSFVQARYAAEILNKICRRELVSPEASDKMLEILLSVDKTSNKISYEFDEGVRFGFVDNTEEKSFLCSMGVVRLTNGRTFVIGITCNGPKNMDSAKDIALELVDIAESYFTE